MNTKIEKELSELQLKHKIHQIKMEDQRMTKVIAREWHRNPNRRRSTPAIILV